MKGKILVTASTVSHILNFHLPYLAQLRRQGWQVHMACGGTSVALDEADEVIALPLKKQMAAPENFRAARLLRERIRREGYALIITHTALAAFFTRLAVKGLRKRPPVINMVHGYLFDDETPFLKRNILLWAEKLTAGETDLLLTMNRWDLEEARRERLGKRVDFVPGIGVDWDGKPWGTEQDRQEIRRGLGVSEEDFVLIYAAEFSGRKSQSVLIRAMTELPQRAVLVLPGSGTELETCKELARELGVAERVRFPGYVKEMHRWYAAADAAVTASRSEGLPFNVMEAMYAGLPVVASAVKGHEDLIWPGESGLLYPYGDSTAYAEQIRRVMDDSALREKLTENARKDVLQYGLETVLPQVMERYLELLPREDGVTAGKEG